MSVGGVAAYDPPAFAAHKRANPMQVTAVDNYSRAVRETAGQSTHLLIHTIHKLSTTCVKLRAECAKPQVRDLWKLWTIFTAIDRVRGPVLTDRARSAFFALSVVFIIASLA